MAANSPVVDVFGFLTFAWATSNAFGQLDVSFHRIWEDGAVPAQGTSFRQVVSAQFHRRRNAFVLLALALTGFVSTSLLVRWLTELEGALSSGRSSLAISIVTPLASWAVGVFFCTLLYRWLAPGKVAWPAALLGAVAASAANLLVRVLVANFVDTTIGATNVNIGGPLALMLGVFLFIQNILIGCILARQYMLAWASDS